MRSSASSASSSRRSLPTPPPRRGPKTTRPAPDRRREGPGGFAKPIDWRSWLDRWEAQQDGFLPDREERFGVMVRMLEELAGPAPSVIDLGCGPGSLAVRIADRLPEARVHAVDGDPLLLEIGRQAVGDRGGRITWVDADLRDPGWPGHLEGGATFDAAMSTTALHWLSPAQLAGLCSTLAGLIRPGGVFMNGDHLTFEGCQPRIARAAGELAAEDRRAHAEAAQAETWTGWWEAVEAEPDLAGLARERRTRWGGHPDHHLPGQATFLRAALLGAGFEEVATVWQSMEDQVMVAVR